MNDQPTLATLPTIAQLLVALDAKAIRYVHWKSNINIGKALMGVDDLDLLVHPDDAEVFEAIIDDIGFQRALSHKDQWQPNMVHYFRPDGASGTMVHLHLHYALTLGHDYHKNFTLPIVDWYLAGRTNPRGMFVPTPEREYIVYVIRQLIKNARSVDVLEFPRPQVNRIRRPGLPIISKSAQAEFVTLGAATDRATLDRALAETGLGISAADFGEFERVMGTNVSRADFHAAAAKLKTLLDATRQTGEATSIWLSALRLNGHRLHTVLTRLHLARPQKKVNVAGGRIIAFIGGDGAGKSTNVEALAKSLKRAFATQIIHVGHPGKTPLGLALAIGVRLASALGRRTTAHALRHLALAFNRRAAFRGAENIRNNGGIALLDRLPNPQISTMDAPRILNAHGRFELWLQAKERAIYRQIGGVDLVIVLRLDPEIACQRRPEDDRETLLKRSGEVWTGEWSQPYMFSIDTGISDLDTVRRAVLERAWACIRSRFVRCEIVGLSGAGKSTVVSALSKRLSNVRTSLPYRKHPFLLTVSAIEQLVATGIPSNSVDRQIFRNLVQLRCFLKMSDRSEKGFAQHNYVLDQGPVFQLILALKEKRLSPTSKYFSRCIGAIIAALDKGIVVLDAPDDVLQQRIRSRPDQTVRALALSPSELALFYKEYRAALELVLSNLPRQMNISTEKSAAEVIDAVWAAVLERQAA